MEMVGESLNTSPRVGLGDDLTIRYACDEAVFIFWAFIKCRIVVLGHWAVACL